jgi:Fe-S cluster assembly protein SufD
MKLSTQESQSAIAAVRQAFDANRVADAPAWLQALQDSALKSFEHSGFPTVRDEDWKYTNLARLAEAGGTLLATRPQATNVGSIEAQLQQLPVAEDDYLLVFANNRFEPALSRAPDSGVGVSITTLANSDDGDRDRLATWLARSSQPNMRSLAALNTAFARDGLIIEVAADRQIEKSLHVVFVTDEQVISTQPRLLVNARKRSSARVFEHHIGSGAGWTNAVTDIHCESAAQLSYIKLQNEDHAADHIASQTVFLAADSQFNAAHIDLGARLARNDLHIRIEGSGAHADLRGFFVADGQRHVDNHTHTDHIAGHSMSREQYHGILNDKGRGVFNGKIVVHEGADGTDAQLNNRNLLLSKTSEIDTKPELEIYTDDVKCAHGATTGQLDEQALFYLRARGISRQTARHMLVLAFAKQVFEHFAPAIGALTDYIDRDLEARLPE